VEVALRGAGVEGRGRRFCLFTGVPREEVTRLCVQDIDLRSAHKSAAVVGLKGNNCAPCDDPDVTGVTMARWTF